MKTLFSKLTFTALAFAAAPVLVASACSGGEFKAVGPDAGTGAAGGNPSGGTGGSQGLSGSGGSSTGVACQGPEECNDGDPCTSDRCGPQGECEVAPKCEAPLVCCEGECGECCGDADCADEHDCTEDICFAGACTQMPDNASCPEGSYCSPVGGCREHEPCPGGTDAECEDGDPCSADSCGDDGLCEHAPCAAGLLCCPGLGCAECCAGSQCGDGDRCTSDACLDGVCQNPALCSAAQDLRCCESSDGTSASCGICCSAAECDDDVPCTADSCEAGSCVSRPDDGECPLGEACSPVGGCVPATECQSPAQCNDQISCTVDECLQGACSHRPDDTLCPGGFCSIVEGGCVACTNDLHCDDGSDCTVDSCNRNTNTCTNTPGACGDKKCCGKRCQDCCVASDCEGVKSSFAPPVFDGGVIGLCSWWTCEQGRCLTSSAVCDQKAPCCPGVGCCAGECCGEFGCHPIGLCPG